MSSLGIYFGSQVISFVESKGRSPANYFRVPHPSFSTPPLAEEKVPEEIKLVNLLKAELLKSRIDAREAIVCLSGKDLIIRHFEMPIMPVGELGSAINFEAKKYIPFKVEELVSDFQWKIDKSIQKNHALFAGIKKETLDKYQAVLNELGFKAVSIEYSAFSMLRLLRMNNIFDKGNIAVVSMDFLEDNEMNFVVLEGGFPLFSRDINFAGPGSDFAGIKQNEIESGLEKVKREIRISFDYYNRKFPLKNIRKIYFILADNYRADLDTFVRELGVAAQFLDVSRFCQNKPGAMSLNFLKAYSASLLKMARLEVKIDLCAPKSEVKTQTSAAATETGFKLSEVKIDIRFVAVGLIMCALFVLLGIYQKLPLQNKLKSILNQRPLIASLRQNASNEEVENVAADYRTKINSMDELQKNRLFVTSLMDAMPRILPEGLWLTNMSFKDLENTDEFGLAGMAYLGDSAKEFEAANNFLSALKKDAKFGSYFREISLVSLNRRQSGKNMVTRFEILCKR